MLIIILAVFLSVVSGLVGLAPLGDLLEMHFFFQPTRELLNQNSVDGDPQQLMFLKFPQRSLMNIKVSQTLELQDSFNVLQEVAITLNWGHLRRVEEGGDI